MSDDIRKTGQAWKDLERITDYFAEQSGSQIAGEAFMDRLEQCFATLATQPLMGPSRDDLDRGLRYHPFENYLIFYRPMPNGIEVARIVHAARDVDALFH